jgi:hypothetical protein
MYYVLLSVYYVLCCAQAGAGRIYEHLPGEERLRGQGAQLRVELLVLAKHLSVCVCGGVIEGQWRRCHGRWVVAEGKLQRVSGRVAEAVGQKQKQRGSGRGAVAEGRGQ